uniref:Secreted protein n=1 Tax=Mesocestoides corti TaxID=53468 RepID=A0A5K3G5H1_MESCO
MHHTSTSTFSRPTVWRVLCSFAHACPNSHSLTPLSLCLEPPQAVTSPCGNLRHPMVVPSLAHATLRAWHVRRATQVASPSYWPVSLGGLSTRPATSSAMHTCSRGTVGCHKDGVAITPPLAFGSTEKRWRQ